MLPPVLPYLPSSTQLGIDCFKNQFDDIADQFELFFTIILLIFVLLCVLVFIFPRYRMNVETKLRAHQEHLEELVEARTRELSLSNGQLWNEVRVRKQAEGKLENTVAELQEALEKVKALSGFLPICCKCKKIRDDEGYWHQVEIYVRNHADVEFSHSRRTDDGSFPFWKARHAGR